MGVAGKGQEEDREFQSHIGAIRINLEVTISTGENAFQSHIGAIRMWKFKPHDYFILNFNPTLVQLELGATEIVNAKDAYFNPTLVQLEYSLTAQKQEKQPYFNPTLVQLE